MRLQMILPSSTKQCASNAIIAWLCMGAVKMSGSRIGDILPSQVTYPESQMFFFLEHESLQMLYLLMEAHAFDSSL